MKPHTAHIAIACLVAALTSLDALAQEGAQVLFSSGALSAIDAGGARRALRQGDVLQAGDTVVTPPGVLAQIRLPDGAMVSARPDSELRLDRIGVNVDRTVLQLNQGNVRVLNIDGPAGSNPRPVDVVSSTSTLQLSRGDGESMLVRPGGATEPGTYNRVQAGEATMRTAGGSMQMQSQQAAFAPRSNASPTIVGEMPRPQMPAAPDAPRGRGDPERPQLPGASPAVAPAGGDARPLSIAGAAPGLGGGMFNSSMRGGPAATGAIGGAMPGGSASGAMPAGGGMAGGAAFAGAGALAGTASAVGRATTAAVTQVINTTTRNRPVHCTMVRNGRGQPTQVCN